MMRCEKVVIIFAMLCQLTTLSVSLSQPVLRPGWPVQLPNPSNSWTFNNLSIHTIPGHGKGIAASTNLSIALIDSDGNYLPGWPVSLDPSQDGLLVHGPRLGNLIGDEEPEVVARVYLSGVGTRPFVYSLAGERLDYNAELPAFVPSMAIRPHGLQVLVNVTGDEHDELFFISDTTLLGLDQNGDAIDGFPLPAGELEGCYHGAPCFGVGAAWPHEAAIFWMTPNQIHGINFSTLESLPGYPIETNLDYNTSPITLIPRPDGWILSVVDRDSLHAWDQTGYPLQGYPVANPSIFSSQNSYDVVAADIDGNIGPELLFHTFGDSLRAYHLDGSIVSGFPLDLGNIMGAADPIAVIKVADQDGNSYLFTMSSITPETSKVFGFVNTELYQGFPITLGFDDWPRGYQQTAVFPPENGSMILTVHTALGWIAAYDVPMPVTDYQMEWSMPGCSPGGNRLYNPILVSDVNEQEPLPEKPDFAPVYPNPSNSGFQFTLQADAFGNASVAVHDILGRLIYRDRLISGPHERVRFAWEVKESVSAGLYFVTLQGATRSTHKAVLLP